MRRSKPFTKFDEPVNILPVGWCETKPAQLNNPGRHSSFPFPHLSPLGAPDYPLSLAFGGQPSASTRGVAAWPSQYRPLVAIKCGYRHEAGSRKPVAGCGKLNALGG